MDNKNDWQSALSPASIFPKLTPKQITGNDFLFEKEEVPCNTPTSLSRYRNGFNHTNLSDSDEYVSDMGSILSLQPWIFKKENSFGVKDGSYGKNKSALRAKRGRRNSIKPLSIENCLIPQLYNGNFEFEEYVFGTATENPIVTRPFVVTDGERVISKTVCEVSLHMPGETVLEQPSCTRKKKGIGVTPLPEMRKSKRKSVDLEEARIDVTDNLQAKLQQPSQGSSNSTAFIFCVGVCIGVLSAIISNRNEVEKLKDKLRCTENLVQDLQEELEMKDALTVQELLPHEDASRTPQEEDGHSMSKIEAELEAELERLELNITAISDKRKTSALDEVDPDLVGEIVQGELRADALTRRHDDFIESRSDNASNSSCSPVDTDTCNYPISPRLLSIRLHEVIQARLEQRIKELEKTLAQSQEQLQIAENERSVLSERTLSNSEMSSSSHQESLVLICQPGPFRLDLTGDALDAYGEACEEFMRVAKEGVKDEVYEVDRGMIWGLEGNVLDGNDDDDDDDDDDGIDYDENDDDEEERLILEKILERTKQGSPVIRHAQMMLLSLND